MRISISQVGTPAATCFISAAEGELTVERAHTELVEKCRGGCDEIVVCEELHSNPAEQARRWHIHAYVKSKNKWDTTDRAYFDISGGHAGRHLHPHIQKSCCCRTAEMRA